MHNKFQPQRTDAISFEYECWEPNIDVDVVANEDGTGILVIDRLTDDEIEFEALCTLDQDNIKVRLKDEVAQLKRFHDERHQRPENDAFGSDYVDWLNKK